LGIIRGALKFVQNDDDVYEIYVLLVSEKWRSKGIGGLLVNQVIEDADTNGYPLKVHPSPDKEHLVRFYGKFGFSKNYNETLNYYSREMYRKPFNINTFKSLYMSDYKHGGLFKNPFSTMKSLIEKNPDLSMQEVHQYARNNPLSRAAKVLWGPNQSEVARIYNSYSKFSLPLQPVKIPEANNILNFDRESEISKKEAIEITHDKKSVVPQEVEKSKFKNTFESYDDADGSLNQANSEDFNALAAGMDTLFERIYALGKSPANDKSDLASVISEVAPIDTALKLLEPSSSLHAAVLNLKDKMASLPVEKRTLIGNEVTTLVSGLQNRVHSGKLDKVIEDFEKNCNRHLAGKHPVLMAIAKAVAVVVIAAFVTVIAGLVGFGIGFAAGAWTGPGAFITGLTAGGAVASAVLGSSSAVGVVATAVSAYGLFKKSPLEKAVHEVARSACSPKQFSSDCSSK
jgi:predicted GNAT family acetyltransferase